MKNKIDRETAVEYIYEYGLTEAAKLLNVTEEDLDNVVNDVITEWKKPHINVNATIDNINPKISEYIEKHYSEWYDKYVKNIDTNIFWQNDEDIFHTSLIKLCSDLSNPSDTLIEKMFSKIFNDSKYRYTMNHRQIKRKEINSIELVDNNDGNEIDSE